MPFDRKLYFDSVRASVFAGHMSDDQVSGQIAILSRWEKDYEPAGQDQRFLAYELATTKHETASEMQPIEEYGKGSGQPYGVPDPQTGQTYFGRGFVQLTWRDNYKRATSKLGLSGANDLEYHAVKALDLDIAAQVMFKGMTEGWFRSDSKGAQKLDRYFNASVDDEWTAREIINGDKHIVPSWSGGVNIGNLIAGYHRSFLAALKASHVAAPVQPPTPPTEPPPPTEPTQPPTQPAAPAVVEITVAAPKGVVVRVNGVVVTTGHV